MDANPSSGVGQLQSSCGRAGILPEFLFAGLVILEETVCPKLVRLRNSALLYLDVLILWSLGKCCGRSLRLRRTLWSGMFSRGHYVLGLFWTIGWRVLLLRNGLQCSEFSLLTGSLVQGRLGKCFRHG